MMITIDMYCTIYMYDDAQMYCTIYMYDADVLHYLYV